MAKHLYSLGHVSRESQRLLHFRFGFKKLGVFGVSFCFCCITEFKRSLGKGKLITVFVLGRQADFPGRILGGHGGIMSYFTTIKYYRLPLDLWLIIYV